MSDKSLKAPDTFQVYTLSALDWARKHSREIGYVVIPLLVIVLGGLTWQYIQTQRAHTRQNALAVVDIQYQKEIEASEKQKDTLRAELGKLPEAPKEGKDPSEAARKDLNDKIRAITADHQKSIESYKKFYEEHASYPEGWVAGLRATALILEQSATDAAKLEQAKNLLAEVLKNSSKSKTHQIQARFMNLGINEDAGNYDLALKDVDALESLVGDELKPAVLLAKGRVLVFKNDKEGAKKAMDELLEKFGSSAEAQKARGIRSMLQKG